jgi:hypothetical protein
MPDDYNAHRDKFYMIQIRHIKLDEIAVARQLIYQVAHQVFHGTRSLGESIAFYEGRGEWCDMDEFQQTYVDNDGIFLVMTDQGQIIGTGAIRKVDSEICELKRVWPLFEYHGKGLGYRMLQELRGCGSKPTRTIKTVRSTFTSVWAFTRSRVTATTRRMSQWS